MPDLSAGLNRPDGTVEVVAARSGADDAVAHSPEVDDYRIFRDFLRADPDAARRYADLKLALATRFGDRRQASVDAKQRQVDVVMEEARCWAASRPRTGPGR